jgi:hypothetical protein
MARAGAWWGDASRRTKVMTTLVLASATGMTAIFLGPQIARVLGTRDRSGLSATWAAFGLVTNAAWIVYLGSLGLWPAVLAPALAVVTYGIMVVALTRESPTRGWMWATGAYGCVLLAVGSSSGVEGIGMVLVVAPLIQLTPAIAAAYRERSPTGIAPATWGLSAFEAVLWGWYGWLVGDMTLIGYGLVTGVGSLLVLSRWLTTRPRIRTVITGHA